VWRVACSDDAEERQGIHFSEEGARVLKLDEWRKVVLGLVVAAGGKVRDDLKRFGYLAGRVWPQHSARHVWKLQGFHYRLSSCAVCSVGTDVTATGRGCCLWSEVVPRLVVAAGGRVRHDN
jgi:hypothetical protein